MTKISDTGPRRAWADAVTAASQGVLRVEMAVAGLLMALLLGLILLNVATRAARMPIYWIDEASVLTLVWLGFIGASVLTRVRIDFAVTLLGDALPLAWQARLRAVATALSLAFGIALVVLCWRWLDPLGIAADGFDARAYAARSFNFLYTERTQTLGWPTWVVSLVMPIFALTFSLHGAANLLEDLGLARRRPQISFTASESAA